MNKLLLPALALLVASCNAAPDTVTISRDTLMDKIKGGWAGQAIGCTYGGPTEFRYQAVTIPDSVALEWPEHQMRHYYENLPGLYDDVYMDLTFVNVFEKYGLGAPVDSFATAFAYAEYPLWHANLQARENIMKGIMPPESGHWKNNPHADCIDFQIEADFAGLMSPAMPAAACRYADGIGHIMNYGDGWYGGVYVAAMYSLAFIKDDIREIVKEAAAVIPENTRYRNCINDVIRWCGENADWRVTWRLCQEKYGIECRCPDAKNNPAFNIDAVTNSAYIVIGLLYGDGDFDKTIEISTRCGQDSDCNPASAGGILATMLGYSGIPDKWMPNLHEVEDMELAYTGVTLNKTYEMSLGQALQVIEEEGGKVLDDKVEIVMHPIVPVRFEQSFTD